MFVRETEEGQLKAAEAVISRRYRGNVIVARERSRNGWKVRLGVLNSRGPGSRKSRTGRRISAACWHAFGHFFDALHDAHIVIPGYRGPAGAHGWVDRNIGSQMCPCMYSEACDCEENGLT